jgi:hypothetical protein
MTWSVYLQVNCTAHQTETAAAIAMKLLMWQKLDNILLRNICHTTRFEVSSVEQLTIHVVLCQSGVLIISKGHSAFIFTVTQPILIGLLDSEHVGTVTIQNIQKYFHSNTASHPRRLDLSAAPP